MNCACYDSIIDLDIVRVSMRRHFKTKPKFLYKIVEIYGDYYYKEMTEEEVLDKAVIELKGTIKNSD